MPIHNNNNVKLENGYDILEKEPMTNGYHGESRRSVDDIRRSRNVTVCEDVPHASKSISDIDYMAFDRISMTVRFLEERTQYRPKIAIICGSGLDFLHNATAGLADLLTNPDIFDYSEVPNFPLSTVPGHKSRLLFGKLNGIQVMLMQGRFHHYEGYPMQLCGMPVRVMKLFGIENVVVTNAAGGLNPEFKAGDIMMLRDHINLPGFTGAHPLKGPNDQRFGGRFFALNNCYDRSFRKMARDVANEIGMGNSFHEGVYTMLGGPNFETVAELRMLRTCGVDAVGMSTIPEVLVACHCGMKVFAFSLITNECIVDENSPESANHEEVIQTAKEKEKTLRTFVTRVVEGMNELTTN